MVRIRARKLVRERPAPGIIPDGRSAADRGGRLFRIGQKLSFGDKNRHLREMAAEFLGMALFIVFGSGGAASYILGRGNFGSWYSVCAGYGFGLLFAYYITAGISGAHLNPAVTIALAIWRKFPWKKVPGYMIAQLAGAFVGAFIVWVEYYDAIDAFDGGIRQVTGPQATAGIFSNYPAGFLSIWNGFMDQFFGSMLLLLGIFALTDVRNVAPKNWAAGLFIGLFVFMLGVTWGLNSGFAVNPARDFGPRLFSWAAGYGQAVFTTGNYYFWIPLVAPFFGAIFGGFLYEFFISWQYPSPTRQPIGRADTTPSDAPVKSVTDTTAPPPASEEIVGTANQGSMESLDPPVEKNLKIHDHEDPQAPAPASILPM